MYIDKQEFTVMHKCPAYYASIMLNVFKHLLCLLLCQHNRRVPNDKTSSCVVKLIAENVMYFAAFVTLLCYFYYITNFSTCDLAEASHCMQFLEMFLFLEKQERVLYCYGKVWRCQSV